MARPNSARYTTRLTPRLTRHVRFSGLQYLSPKKSGLPPLSEALILLSQNRPASKMFLLALYIASDSYASLRLRGYP
jgi:hypothetical protein